MSLSTKILCLHQKKVTRIRNEKYCLTCASHTFFLKNVLEAIFALFVINYFHHHASHFTFFTPCKIFWPHKQEMRVTQITLHGMLSRCPLQSCLLKYLKRRASVDIVKCLQQNLYMVCGIQINNIGTHYYLPTKRRTQLEGSKEAPSAIRFFMHTFSELWYSNAHLWDEEVKKCENLSLFSSFTYIEQNRSSNLLFCSAYQNTEMHCLPHRSCNE